MKRFVLGLLLLLLVAVGHALLYDAPFEDAFITYRYAENFAAGHGFVYNLGEPVDGYTSFLWTLILGVSARLGAPLPVLAPLLSLLFGLIAVVLTAAIGRRQLDLPQGNLLSLLPATVFVACGGFAYYASSGMETMLFLALLLCAIWLTLLPITTLRLCLVGVVLGLAALTRPEGLAYAFAHLFVLSFRAQKRDTLAAAVGFCAIYCPYFLVHYHYYGHPFPNTYYAKASPSRALFSIGAVRAEAFLTSHGYWAALLAILYLLRKQPREPQWFLVLVVMGTSLLTNIAVGGDAFAFYRFLLPTVPVGAIAIVAAARLFLGTRTHRLWQPLAILVALLWLVGTVGTSYLPPKTLTYRRVKSERELYRDVRAINEDYFAVGSWLRAQIPPRSLIATNAAGIVPYVSGLPTLDMLGLNDVHIAHRSVTLGRGVSGHEKFDADYVLSREPEIILLGLPMLSRKPLLPEQFDSWVARWLWYLPGDRALYYSDAFRRNYAPIGVPLEGGQLILFVRRHAVN